MALLRGARRREHTYLLVGSVPSNYQVISRQIHSAGSNLDRALRPRSCNLERVQPSAVPKTGENQEQPPHPQGCLSGLVPDSSLAASSRARATLQIPLTDTQPGLAARNRD